MRANPEVTKGEREKEREREKEVLEKERERERERKREREKERERSGRHEPELAHTLHTVQSLLSSPVCHTSHH